MACSLALRLPLLAGLSFIFLRSDSQVDDLLLPEPLFSQLNTCKKDGRIVPCWPGSEACGAPFQDAPSFHLMSQHGCAENDPNGPVFDPVHGVIHHFYQAHLAANEGVGPIYGHFVSKDFVHWTELPVAIWNGLDTSSEPPRLTFYDTVAIYTGSALLLEGAGPNGAPGIVQIYPGLCDAHWPECLTGTVLAQAVPADYSDQLLTNWTKPLSNPIMENVQRDPTTPWKEATGEWRLRTFDGEFYGSANDADLLQGKWYRLGAGDPKMWPTCECPSFFPLPGVTPGFEIAASSERPSHVQKLSCAGHDWWMIGSYTLPNRSAPGNFSPTVGWEDLFQPQLIDAGAFYASKDALYPSKTGRERRINWGWAQVRPNGTQSLPRVITFNPQARLLEQAPLPELEELRGSILVQETAEVSASAPYVARLPFLSALRSETVVRFTLPRSNAILRVGFSPSPNFAWLESVGLAGPDVNVTTVPKEDEKVYGAPYLCQRSCEEDSGCVAWSFVHQSATCYHKGAVEEVTMAQQSVSGVKQSLPALSCAVFYEPVESKGDMEAICGNVKAPLRLLAAEKSLEIRIFADATFLEVFFQGGRLAMTVPEAPPPSSELMISATVETSAEVSAYAMKSIWVNEEYVRKQSRVYPSQNVDLWS